MKPSPFNLIRCLALGAALPCLAGCIAPRAADVNPSTPMSDLPPAVQRTIRTDLAGEPIGHVERQTHTGEPIHVVTLKRPGADERLHIASDGTIIRDTRAAGTSLRERAGAGAAISSSDGDSVGSIFAGLPESVKQTITAHAGAAEIAEIVRETPSGQPVYEVRFRELETNPPMRIAEDGSLLPIQEATPEIQEPAGAVRKPSNLNDGDFVIRTTTLARRFRELPVAVRETIRQDAAGWLISGIRRTPGEPIHYEIILERNGEKRRTRIATDGSLVGPAGFGKQ